MVRWCIPVRKTSDMRYLSHRRSAEPGDHEITTANRPGILPDDGPGNT
jgi:hypothetical protein